MTTQNFIAPSIQVSPAPVAARGDEGQAAAAYRRPKLVVAGSTVELVQGCYCAPFMDLSGYYTYGN